MGYQGIPGVLGRFKGILGNTGSPEVDLEGSQGLFGRVPRMDLGRLDLGRSVESQGSLGVPGGILPGPRLGGVGKKGRCHNPPIRGAVLIVNSHQAKQSSQTCQAS